MSDLLCVCDEVHEAGGEEVDADVGGLVVGQEQRQGLELIPTQKNLEVDQLDFRAASKKS